MSEKNMPLNFSAGGSMIARAPNQPSTLWPQKVILELLRQATLYIILIAGSIPFVFPLLFMVSTSLKTKGEALLIPIRWIPSEIVWSNYYEAMFGFVPLY